MTIKPLFDKVVLKKPEKKETTKSGIILAATAQETPDFMEVIAVGDGAVVDGEKQPMLVKVGDKVLFGKWSGTEIKLEGEPRLIMKESDILAIVE
ncbi:MAG: co-chaperone GroES [Oscillospiraceae bacterium]|nr:co-chaperone GroES [Oscillospiraceae bacterium]